MVINRKQEILCGLFDRIIDSKDYAIVESVFQLFFAQEDTDSFNKYILAYVKTTGGAIIGKFCVF
jgi:hypothetical protein